MKVLIADDEVKVCNLIQNLVDWEALGLEIAGVVHDGKSALEFISAQRPEVVITDIRMPECSGIDMISSVRAQGLDTQFIIISGYKEFEYANQAIKNDVADYLLKPIKQKEIEKALRKIIREQGERQAQLEERADWVQRIHTDRQRLKEHFLEDLVKGRLASGEALDQERINERYGSHFGPGDYVLLLIQEAPPSRAAVPFGETLFKSKVKSLLENEWVSKCVEMATALWEDCVVCLVNDEAGGARSMDKSMRRISGKILGMGDEFGFAVGISGTASGLLELPRCVEEAQKALAQRLLLEPPAMVVYSPACEPVFRVEDIITVKWRNELRKRIQMHEKEPFVASIRAIGAALERDLGTTGSDVRQICDEIAQVFFHSTRDSGIEVSESFFQQAREQYRRARTVMGAFDGLVESMCGVIDTWHEKKKAEASRPIRNAQKYIQEHYAEPLTLQTLSEVAGLNAAYFSSAFKKETGNNFLDYLTQVRVDAAKELLASTEMDLWDVAEHAGFTNMKYFFKRFKQYAGVSPSGYRKLYG